MKKILSILTITGALMIANAQSTTDYKEVHTVSNSKSSVLSGYVDIHDVSNSKSITYSKDK